MSYLWKVWTIPYLQLSAVDETVMGLEVLGGFLLIAVIKVYVIDRLRGVRYYRG